MENEVYKMNDCAPKSEKIYRSKKWKDQRDQLLNGAKCSICGKENNLVVHHTNGLKLGDSGYDELKLGDVVILCKSCHYKIHRKTILKQKHKPIIGQDGRVRLHPYDKESWSYMPCYPPGSNSNLRIERRKAGLCEMCSSTCKGEIKECPICGYRYCEYHFSCHINYYVRNKLYGLMCQNCTNKSRRCHDYDILTSSEVT